MSFPFSAAFCEDLAVRCAAFPRLTLEAAGLKPAAVALALVEADDGSGETAFLLTRRSSRLRAHAGQWALPGGRCDAGETVEAAALRELDEELGLRPSAEAVLGVLDDYPTRSGYVIAPVVVWLEDTAGMRLNALEVEFVHRIRLDRLIPDDIVEFEAIPESPRPVIRLQMGADPVHAPTAALIYQLRELLAGRLTRVADLEQPVFAWR